MSTDWLIGLLWIIPSAVALIGCIVAAHTREDER